MLLIRKHLILSDGTSIQQGGVASRAGTAYDAVISRALGREIFNIGFANNGVMELSVAAMLVDIKEAAAIVIDCACSSFCGSFGISP